MRSKLFQTQSDTFLGIVEVQNNDIELLIEFDDLFGVIYAAPAQVGDVDLTVYAAQVDEYTVRGDIFNSTFEDLTFFEFRHDLFFLSLEFGFDQSFV